MNKKAVILIVVLAAVISVFLFSFFRTKPSDIVVGDFLASIESGNSQAAYETLSSELRDRYGDVDRFRVLFADILRSENELDSCSYSDEYSEGLLVVFMCDRKSSENKDLIISTVDGNTITDIRRDGLKSYNAER